MNIYELDNYSDREVLDYVYNTLLEQGRGSYKLDGTGYPLCKYRGAEGTKCGIGVLIPDEKYRPDMEGRGLDEVCAWMGVEVSGKRHRILLLIQEIHDYAVREAHETKLPFPYILQAKYQDLREYLQQ